MLPALLTTKTFAAQAAVQGSAVIWAAGGGDGNAIKLSLIGGVFLVLAGAIPAWINSRGGKGESPSVKALIDSNNQRRREYAVLAKEHAKCSARQDELENMLWAAGINPHTGERTNA